MSMPREADAPGSTTREPSADRANGLDLSRDTYRVTSKVAQPLPLIRRGEDGSEKVHTTIPPFGSRKFTWPLLATLDYEPLLEAEQITLQVVEPEYTLTNKTSRRIGIESVGEGRPLVIPAFGSRRLSLSILKQYRYEPWRQMNLIEVTRIAAPEEPTIEDDLSSLYAAGAVILPVALGIVAGVLGRSTVEIWRYLQLFFLVYVIIGVVGAIVTRMREGQLARLVNAGLLISFALLPILLVVGLFGDGAALLQPERLSSGALGRGLQFFLILLFSLLPGLLFFQFERQQVTSIREKLLREIMMLNPSVVTLDDARITYGTLVDEVSGTVGESSRQYAVLGTNFSLLLSTWLISFGWLFTVSPIGPISALDEGPLIAALTPGRTALGFAFLGAYLFALNMIFRRYIRGDLTPKAYNHIIVRILTTLILVWVISVLPGLDAPESWLLVAVAFLVGIFPESGLALIQDAVRNVRFLANVFPSLREKHPVTDLDGINLYDRVRLLEEGIESIDNLVHINPIELMVRTRMPTARLVDLVDQALLYLHVRGVRENGVHQDHLRRLHAYGILNATTLLQVYELSSDADQNRLMALLGPEDPAHPRRLRMIYYAILDHKWIPYLRHWRATGDVSERVFSLQDFYSTGLVARPGAG